MNRRLWCKCTVLVLFSQPYFDFCFRLAAQYARMRSDCALRAAADIPPRFFGLAAGAEALFAELPRCAAPPCKAWIARFNRSRSATKRATICSVCITPDPSIINKLQQGSKRNIFAPEFGMRANEAGHHADAILFLHHLNHHPLIAKRILCT